MTPFRARSDEVVPIGRAIEYCNNRVAAEPRNDLHYTRRALVWLQLGERDRALADLTEAIRFNPDDPEAHLLRGDLRMLKEDDLGARADHDRALALHRSASGAHRHLGPATRSRSLTCRDVPAPVVLPAGLLPQPGRRRNAPGDYVQALADFDTALRLDPTYYQAINDRAWVFATAADPAFRDPVESLANAARRPAR